MQQRPCSEVLNLAGWFNMEHEPPVCCGRTCLFWPCSCSCYPSLDFTIAYWTEQGTRNMEASWHMMATCPHTFACDCPKSLCVVEQETNAQVSLSRAPFWGASSASPTPLWVPSLTLSMAWLMQILCVTMETETQSFHTLRQTDMDKPPVLQGQEDKGLDYIRDYVLRSLKLKEDE